MKIDELKQAKDQRPFKPFLIRMADGRELEARHPDAVAWDIDTPRTVHCVVPGGGWVRIDVALITSLAEAPRPPSSGAKSSPRPRRGK